MTNRIINLKLCAVCIAALFLSSSCSPDLQGPRKIKMVFVKGGSFTMGVKDEYTGLSYPLEKPAHVVILSDFYMSDTEITYYQFKQFIDETLYETDAERNVWIKGSWVRRDSLDMRLETASWKCRYDGEPCDSTDFDKPVLHLSWHDAIEFCKWLSTKEKRNYRLPTEAEWEYAAKGGSLSKGFIFSGSDNPEDVAWFFQNSQTGPQPVATKLPNELGIYDMSGNVNEWTMDYSHYYMNDTLINPMVTQQSNNRACRGGSWSRYRSYCRNTNRNFFIEHNRGGGLGFRVVYIPEKK